MIKHADYARSTGQAPVKKSSHLVLKACLSKVIVNKSSKCNTWVQPQKWQWSQFIFQGKPFHSIVIQVYVPTTDAEEEELTGSMKTYNTF